MERSKKVCVIDLIGSYAGMDYYDSSFCKELASRGFVPEVLSTFSIDNRPPFLPVMFRKRKLAAIPLMLYNYCKLFGYMVKHRKSSYIYMSFGEVYDFLFLSLSAFSKRFYVDIHELYAAKHTANGLVKRIFAFFYRHIVRNVIYHSDKTIDLLQRIPYTGNALYVPHFKYSMETRYDLANVDQDVLSQFNSENIKFLFFGNLREVKGIDIVVDFFGNRNLEKDVELVIAGKNVENIALDSLKGRYGVIDRHINDDELKYLYSKTDYVLLPYRDSSQSGILEMAFCFRKPMLLSRIPYFEKVIAKFPSFGEIEDIENYGSMLERIIGRGLKTRYYSTADCDSFLMRSEIDSFMTLFCSQII